MNRQFILQQHNADRAEPHQDLYLEEQGRYVRSLSIGVGKGAIPEEER